MIAEMMQSRRKIKINGSRTARSTADVAIKTRLHCRQWRRYDLVPRGAQKLLCVYTMRLSIVAVRLCTLKN